MRTELNDFYNEGFGWICRHCERELQQPEGSGPSRLLLEGESESKKPRLANPAIARWAEPARTSLVCPTCGITETVDKS